MKASPLPRLLSSRRAVDTLLIVGMLLLLLVMFRHALFAGRPVGLGHAAGDGRTQFYPWRVFGFNEWRTNGVPLWNPHVLLGMPFVANLQSAMFYPLHWLCFAMPTYAACNWAIVLNLFLSALFAYLLARRLGVSSLGACAAALTYTLAANHIFRVYQGHWSILAAMPWLPALLLCTEEVLRSGRLKWVVLGAAALGLQLLAGMPQITFYTGLFSALYFVTRYACLPKAERPRPRAFAARAGLMLGVAVLALVLSAVQMVPALELAGESSRVERVELEWATQYGLAPEGLITLLVPKAFGPSFGAGLPYWGRWAFWEVACYMGVVGFALLCAGLAGASWRRWLPWAVPGAFFLFIALGRYHSLYGPLFEHVPGFNLFRAPGRAVAVLGLSVGLLAGLGFDAVFRGKRVPTRVRWTVIALAGAVIVSCAVAYMAGPRPEAWMRAFDSLWAQSERPYLREKPPAAFVAEAWEFFRTRLLRSAMLLGALALLVTLRDMPKRRMAWAGLAVVVLLAGDLYTFGRTSLATFDPSNTPWTADVRRGIDWDGQPVRVSLRSQWKYFPCDAMMFGVSAFEGIEPNVPRRLHDFFWTAQGRALNVQRTVYFPRRLSAMTDLVNLRYTVALRPWMDDIALQIDPRPGAMRRAFLVHRAEVVHGREAALARLERIDFRTTALLEEPPTLTWREREGREPIPRFERYDSRGARIRVHALTAGMLVVSDLHYPGWRATVDGEAVSIRRVDYLLRGVEVPEGEHVVEFSYAPRSFAVGLWLSIVGWLLTAAVFAGCVIVEKRRANGEPAEKT